MHLTVSHLLFKSICLTVSEQVISESWNHREARLLGGVSVDSDGGCVLCPVKRAVALDGERSIGILSCEGRKYTRPLMAMLDLQE